MRNKNGFFNSFKFAFIKYLDDPEGLITKHARYYLSFCVRKIMLSSGTILRSTAAVTICIALHNF